MTLPSPTFGIPDRNAPLSSFQDAGGQLQTTFVADVWFKFLTRLQQQSAERPIAVLSPGSSPFEYQATCIGSLSVTGGTGVSAALTRGAVTVPVASALIPMAAWDVVRVLFSSAPVVSFIPGART